VSGQRRSGSWSRTGGKEEEFPGGTPKSGRGQASATKVRSMALPGWDRDPVSAPACPDLGMSINRPLVEAGR
jgi:hypothetical protein